MGAMTRSVMTRSAVMAAVLLAGIGAGAPPALAAEEGGAAPVRPGLAKRCRAELAQRCPEAEGGEAQAACLVEHEPSLGAGCRAALRRAQRVAAFRAACSADVAQVCGGVAPGKGRIRACLRAHASEVSPACGELLGRPRGKGAAAEQAATADEAVIEDQAGLPPVPDGEQAGEARPAGGEPEEPQPPAGATG
jgi:hypothetical protein